MRYILKIYLFFYVYEYIVWMYVCAYLILSEARDGPGIKDHCKLPCVYKDLNPGPLQEKCS